SRTNRGKVKPPIAPAPSAKPRKKPATADRSRGTAPAHGPRPVRGAKSRIDPPRSRAKTRINPLASAPRNRGAGRPAHPQAAGQPQGGQPGSAPADQAWRATEDEADEANLDYARKATDLALEHLKKELRKDQPDPELLKRLGWTRGELESFVNRWEQMRRQA